MCGVAALSYARMTPKKAPSPVKAAPISAATPAEKAIPKVKATSAPKASADGALAYPVAPPVEPSSQPQPTVTPSRVPHCEPAASSELMRAFAARTPSLTDLGFGLLLGSGRAAADVSLLRRHQVTHVLNVADDVPRTVGDDFGYCCLGVTDFGGDAGITRVFEQAFDFVQGALNGEGTVLVHCANGSNRSPTVVIAVLMLLHDWPLATAWEHVACRRKIAPLADNREQLLAFELSRRGVASAFEAPGGTLVPLIAHEAGTAQDPETVDTAVAPAAPAPAPSDAPAEAVPPTAGSAGGAGGAAAPQSTAPRSHLGRLNTIDENEAVDPLGMAAPRDVTGGDQPPAEPAVGQGQVERGAKPQGQAEGGVCGTCGKCDKCDGPHPTDDCPHFPKPRESPPAEGVVSFDESAGIYTFACPWCEEVVVVRPQDVACKIFRHAEFKRKAGRFRFVNPHAPQAECERWVREDLIVGCGKPFRLDAPGGQAKRVSKCGYL